MFRLEFRAYFVRIYETMGKRGRKRMSGQVGRNDPCPCGSGKKYKKCCMLKNAVSITALLEKDAAALHNRIIDYAVTSYSEELTKDFQEKVEYLIIKDR